MGAGRRPSLIGTRALLADEGPSFRPRKGANWPLQVGPIGAGRGPLTLAAGTPRAEEDAFIAPSAATPRGLRARTSGSSGAAAGPNDGVGRRPEVAVQARARALYGQAERVISGAAFQKGAGKASPLGLGGLALSRVRFRPPVST